MQEKGKERHLLRTINGGSLSEMNLVNAVMVFKYAYHLTQGFHFRTVTYRIACIGKQECSLQHSSSECKFENPFK